MSTSTPLPVRLTSEVKAALHDGRPVVALESSVICQGLPRPHNRVSAQECEHAIREEGAIPATVALIDGHLVAGLSGDEFDRLSTEPNLWKLGERDLAVGIAQRGTGGTTVSATLAVAELVGIRVFATGGIGGVHRGDGFDVSADLLALARHPIAVVCAGAKSILDLPRTLEMLETLSIPVIGLRTRELPAFYVSSSGLPLEHHVEDERDLARLVGAHFDLGLTSAVLAVQPCPSAVALPAAEVEEALTLALAEAERTGVRGKAVTPFLLSAVAQATSGRALTANLALLQHNARAASRLAIALIQESGGPQRRA